jgi:ATP/maltotriose-dependent transcriptional regulator MalT
VIDLSRQWSSPVMISYPRTEHVVALTLWGRWEEAERELEAVIENPGDRPLMAALAKLRLADLGRRQGRFADAQALLRELQAETNRVGQGHLTGAVAAAVELDRGDPAKAVELAERYLRAIPPDDVVERPDGLDVLARARIALGDADRAEAAADELAGVAERVPTSPFRAAARLASGLVARAREELESALDALEEAADLFSQADAPFETGRARVELGRVLLDLGRPDAAAEETHKALAGFEALGADRDAEAARSALETLGAPSRRERADLPLTPREAEVLRLVASGRSNEEIAAELVLSVRTVERHISNIYAKIGAHGRTAQAVATAYAHTHALA